MTPTSTLSLDLDDAMSHNWIVGSNGAGKSNVLLYRLRLLAEETQKERPCALIFIDPHGDAGVRLAQALGSWDKLTIVDPAYVSFGLNPLELPPGLSASERMEAIQTQVGELEAILWELFKDNLETAPRMLTIFRTSLYYLYGTAGKPTFRDLFELLLKMSQMERSEIPAMLRLGDVEDEMIAAAMAAISTLTKDAFNPGINRISKFVMPSGSMNARTFCSSGSRLDFHKMLEPGQVTVFRLPKFQLPTEFGPLVSAVVVVRLFLIVQERARKMERAGKESRERTPVILAVDEFQNIASLSVVGTILTEARKFGLFLWMVHQNLDQLGEDVLNTVMGNAGAIFAFRVGPEDAKALAAVMSPQKEKAVAKYLAELPNHHVLVRKNPTAATAGFSRVMSIAYPRLPPPLHSEADVIDFMRYKMDALYGGDDGSPGEDIKDPPSA